MPWPRGVPRKNHINKNGEPHAKRGTKLARDADTLVSVVRERPTPERPPAIKVTRLSPEPENDNPNHPLKLHGATFNAAGRPNRPITEPCPNCMYAYADGGYCEECGWTKPINRLPYGTASGKKSK